ncbi:MAG: PRC-barrel domain-containing protein [Bacillota bacterium]
MKSLKEIISLPIISVCDGQEAGKIKSVVIDPEGRKIEYFVVDDRTLLQVKIVAMSKIMGIGDEALMIETSNLVMDAQKDSRVVELLNRNISIVQSKVFTKKGKNLGVVCELFVDEESGKIIGCEILKDGVSKFMSSDSVITFGKDITVVEHEIHDKLMASIEEVLGKEKKVEDETSFLDTAEAIQKSQREYLLGREVTNLIMDGDTVLAFEGQTVTEELIEKVEQAGKFMELTINVN